MGNSPICFHTPGRLWVEVLEREDPGEYGFENCTSQHLHMVASCLITEATWKATKSQFPNHQELLWTVISHIQQQSVSVTPPHSKVVSRFGFCNVIYLWHISLWIYIKFSQPTFLVFILTDLSATPKPSILADYLFLFETLFPWCSW